MNHHTRFIVTIVLIMGVGLAGIGIWNFGLPYLEATQRYPSVIYPSEAYLASNDTLYLGVYNAWTKPINLTSVQVAEIPAGEASGVYSTVEFPGTSLTDGSVKIFCCLTEGNTRTVVAKSVSWTGGGEIPAGGVTLMKFLPVSPPGPGPKLVGPYYLAIGSQWFPSVNLAPFTTTVSSNVNPPALVPIHAIVYPNDSMDIGVVGKSAVELGDRANISFAALWIHYPLNATYRISALRSNWYRLSLVGDLPPYFQVTDEPYIPSGDIQYDNRTSFEVLTTSAPALFFGQDMVTQVPPILSPTWLTAGGTGSGGGYTQSYGVQWQIQMNGSSVYRIPLTVFGGQYWVNSSQNVEIKVGGVTSTSPGYFNSSYFSGDMVVTILGPIGKSGDLNVVLEYGPHFQMGKTTVIASTTVTQ